ncbi:MAG: VWA domain-containing protein [Myxococcales bacterium]|nr:VWA domain-containing protein [Myxococcales bacterium]
MTHTFTRPWAWLLLSALASCVSRPLAEPEVNLQSGVRLPVINIGTPNVDVLFVIDNSNSMGENQARLARQFDVLIAQLVTAPRDPRTGRPTRQRAESVQVGVISTDLGTPGTALGSCDNADGGDEGLLNPIRYGLAMRRHQPWASSRASIRPARCTNDPAQYPSFLSFAAGGDTDSFREDFVCNAFLATQGCGLEQPLEAAYRALVTRNPRQMPGNGDPNAGFVRPDAVLALVVITDEEDGSVRDCRYAEAGDPDGDCRAPRGSALGVYDSDDTAWGDDDLNLRFYRYTPGSAQDPTWNLNRYIDPARPDRGFLSLKPSHPERVVFSAIAGVPLALPRRPDQRVDWERLLGRRPAGDDALDGPSPEGPVSMRQGRDDAQCPGRVMPACRSEGSRPVEGPAGCDPARQYFALPSRRIAEVARRFDALTGNGSVASICANDYAPALADTVALITQNLGVPCLPRALETSPRICGPEGPDGACVTPEDGTPVQVRCVVREVLPASIDAARWCTAAHGRRLVARHDNGTAECLVEPLAVVPRQRPAPGRQGFYYDTAPDPLAPNCQAQIRFTDEAAVPVGARATIECVQSVGAP